MAADGSVVILIEGDDSNLKSKLSGIGSLAASAAKTAVTAIAGISTALAGVAAAAVKAGAAYETSLAKVGTIADTFAKPLADLSREIIQLSNDTGEGAAELNEALYSAISAGADTEQAVDLVAVAVKAARGGFTDTETAVDGLTSALNAYAMETADAQGLANKFLVTQNLGKTTFGQLASSIGTVAPTANAAGVSVDELLASVASLTANGIGTSEAMTGMKAALSNIIKPTGEAAKLAQQLGIDFSAASLQTKGWAGFLAELQEKTGGNTDQMATLFGSVEALNTVLTLTSEQGTALMTKTLDEMASNTTALDDAYEAMSGTLEVTVQKIGTNLQNLGIQFYESVQGPAQEAANGVLEAVQSLSAAFQEGGLTGAVQALGGIAASALTALASSAPAFIDTAVELIQSFLSGLRDNLPEIATAATEILESLVGGILETLPDLTDIGLEIISTLASGIADSLPELIPSAVDTVLKIAETLTDPDNLGEIIDSALEIITSLANGLVDSLPKLAERVPKIIKNIVDTLTENFPKIITAAGNIILTLAKGLIDSIPDLAAAVPDLVDSIVEGFSKLGDSFWTIGEDIVSGIWNGVSSMASWVRDKVSGFATGILDGIKSTLGIHSPSKVAEKEIGPYIPQGVAVGVEKEIPKTERAVSKQLAGLTGRVRAAVEAETANISVGLSAKGNGWTPPDPAPNGGTVVNVYVSGETPENREKARNLGRELGQETARELRRRGIAST